MHGYLRRMESQVVDFQHDALLDAGVTKAHIYSDRLAFNV